MAESLASIARRSDARVAEARAELVAAVRRAAADGMTQAQIAAEIGRSQPEVSRLLRFHGGSDLARRLRSSAPELRRRLREEGGVDLRVFGSLAAGDDRPGSDVDLLFAMRRPIGLMALARLEREFAELVGADVDLVPESSLRPDVRDRILAESVRL